MFWIQAVLIFLFAACTDWLSIIWHEARESNKPIKGAVVGVVLGVIAWLSIIWVVADSRWLMAPGLMGAALGSYYGIRHYHSPVDGTPAKVVLRWLGFSDKTKEE